MSCLSFTGWTGEKWLSAPINSRAGLVHNKYINDNNVFKKGIYYNKKLYQKYKNYIYNCNSVH